MHHQTRHIEAPVILLWIQKNSSESRLVKYTPFITLISPTLIVTSQYSTSSSHNSSLCPINISKVKYTISDDSLRNYSDIRLTTDLEIRPPTKLLDKILSDSLINIIKQFNSVH